MSIAYFDCFAGAAGDMILGAFVDAGLPVSYLKRELKKLRVDGYVILRRSRRISLTSLQGLPRDSSPSAQNDRKIPSPQGERVRACPVLDTGVRGGFSGTDLKVEVVREPHLKHYADIKKLIEKSSLSKNVKRLAIAIFEEIATAEAHVHGHHGAAHVHFHEIGGLDSIIDIVGAAIAVDFFKFDKIYSSPLPVTRGYIKCAHGRLPCPAPATLEMLKGIPVVSSPVKFETVTPTGAAILKTISSGFCALPLREIKKTGYGFGDADLGDLMNAVRIMIGEGERLFAIEANIDDMNPEFYPYIIEKLLDAGALDAGLIPMVMKKGRPGAILHSLADEGKIKTIIDVMTSETTTFGVRYFPVDREMASREHKKVKTKYGEVRVKIARFNGAATTIAPEHADCAKLAKKKKVPLKDVYREAMLEASSLPLRPCLNWRKEHYLLS